MNIYLVIFVIVSIIVGGFGSYTFFSDQRAIAGGIFFIGAILTFVFFGMRWFGPAGSPLNPTPVQWPPYINTCPDYLTYFKRTKADGTTSDTCIDRIGVSKNAQLQVFPASNPNQDNDAYFFPLSTSSNDSSAQRQELCQRTIQYGLTWEGVTDGESCFTPGGAASVPSSNAAGIYFFQD